MCGVLVGVWRVLCGVLVGVWCWLVFGVLVSVQRVDLCTACKFVCVTCWYVCDVLVSVLCVGAGV